MYLKMIILVIRPAREKKETVARKLLATDTEGYVHRLQTEGLFSVTLGLRVGVPKSFFAHNLKIFEKNHLSHDLWPPEIYNVGPYTKQKQRTSIHYITLLLKGPHDRKSRGKHQHQQVTMGVLQEIFCQAL